MLLLLDVATGWRWLRPWGGLGLVAIGILDSSPIPTAGGLDIFTILFAARNKELWFYYALMATLGSVLGAYLTYRIGRKGGKETLEQKFPKKRLERVYRMFEKWGFGAVFLSGVLPPPFPMAPFLFGAGALKLPLRQFLAAVVSARLLRFTGVAYLASLYGPGLIRLISNIGVTGALVGIALIIGIGVAAFLVLRRRAQHAAS